MLAFLRSTSLFCPSTGVRSYFVARLLFLVFLALAPLSYLRAEKIDQLSPQGYVNDFANAIDADNLHKLTALCAEVDQKAGAQIAVVTIHTLEGDSVDDFANRLFQKWGVGPKGKDRGVMILLAVDDRQYRTEVGYGLEPILPDGKVGDFGRDMRPLLQQKQYGAALLQIASSIAAVIAQDRGVALTQAVPAAPLPPSSGGEGSPFFGIPANVLFFLIVLLFFGGMRFLGFLFALFGWSRYRRGRGSGGGWWMGPMGGMGGGWGGGAGGGSWGGGGFGGFGGGSSGGGGAAGSW